MSAIDMGIIKFEPHPNAEDKAMMLATVDELEMYVGLIYHAERWEWSIEIDGVVVADEYTDSMSAAYAALGHLIVRAVDVSVQYAGSEEAEGRRRARLCRRWVSRLVNKLNRP